MQRVRHLQERNDYVRRNVALLDGRVALLENDAPMTEGKRVTPWRRAPSPSASRLEQVSGLGTGIHSIASEQRLGQHLDPSYSGRTESCLKEKKNKLIVFL